jgi:hypothetical protein
MRRDFMSPREWQHEICCASKLHSLGLGGPRIIKNKIHRTRPRLVQSSEYTYYRQDVPWRSRLHSTCIWCSTLLGFCVHKHIQADWNVDQKIDQDLRPSILVRSGPWTLGSITHVNGTTSEDKSSISCAPASMYVDQSARLNILVRVGVGATSDARDTCNLASSGLRRGIQCRNLRRFL